MPFGLKPFFGALACVALSMPAPLAAQESEPSFELDLNSAADTANGSCRLTIVAKNSSDTALDRTAYQIGIFDSDGAFTRLLAVEFGALIENKTKILQFDLPETGCGSIGRILINDVVACEIADGGGDSDLCLNGLTATSRTDIEFGL